MQEILDRIKVLEFKEKFDLLVAIGRGGIVPAAILNQKFNVDLKILWLRFRDDDNNEESKSPKLMREMDFSVQGKKVLIVDDVSRSGKSLEYAKSLLSEADTLKTFVVNGNADYFLYDEECFKFPWKLI